MYHIHSNFNTEYLRVKFNNVDNVSYTLFLSFVFIVVFVKIMYFYFTFLLKIIYSLQYIVENDTF